MARSALEDLLMLQIRAARLPMPEREVRFHDQRKWRFDFAYCDRMLAFEVEGGTYSNGSHNRAKGFEEDCEKYNEAVLSGWVVFRFTGDMVKDGRAIEVVKRALENSSTNEHKKQ